MDSGDPEMSWWLHPTTGEVIPHVPDVEGTEEPEDDDWVVVPSTESRDGYRDMADFVATVTDPRLAERLERAITGRGAFRRFKDELYDQHELRQQWFRFRDARAARRALDWLEAEGLVTPADADEVRGLHPDPF